MNAGKVQLQKMMAGTLAALMITGGFAATGGTVFAAEENVSSSSITQQRTVENEAEQSIEIELAEDALLGDQIDRNAQADRHNEKIWLVKKIADYLDLTKEDLQALKESGYTLRQLVHAAPIAKLSGTDVAEVLAYKATDNTWQEVAEKYGVSYEEMRGEFRKLFGERLAHFFRNHPAVFVRELSLYLQMKPEVIVDLLKKYQAPAELAHAAVLSKLSGASLQLVVGMHQNGMEWVAIAKNLGVDYKEVRQEVVRIIKHLHKQFKEYRENHGNDGVVPPVATPAK